MKCKNCKIKDSIKYSKYSTGEFCCRECARGFSTKNKRSEINEKVSKKLVGRELSVQTIEKLKGKNNGRYNHNITEEERKLKCNKQPRIKQLDVINICPICKSNFSVPYKQRKQECCSKKCSMNKRYASQKYKDKCCEWGKKSANSQNKRSKNEIYFGELCKKSFNIVDFNKPMFNGWDADIIIEKLKIAVLWNGKWHYEKITEKHSIGQVQNRDRIKIKEIIKLGYEPYIIKDMGRYKKKFVEEQFSIFKKHIAGSLLVSPRPHKPSEMTRRP